MNGAITFDREDVKASQRAMILALEKYYPRKAIAAHLQIDVSYLAHIVNPDNNVAGGASLDRGLMSMCSSVDEDGFVEGVLPHGKYVAKVSEATVNGRYDDEVMKAAELLGDTTKAVKHYDDDKLRQYARGFGEVAASLEQEVVQRRRRICGKTFFE